MKEFVVYTLARIGLFVASYAVIAGVYLLVTGGDTLPLLWPLLLERADVHEVGDRRAAIALAVRAASGGDTVVVAGKGHETGQEVGGTVHPFDDRDVLREELAAR